MAVEPVRGKAIAGSKAAAVKPATAKLQINVPAPVHAPDVGQSGPGLKVRARAKARAAQATLFQFAKNLSPLQTHDLVTEGLPVLTARDLMASFSIIDRGAVLRAVGISERTLQRGQTGNKLLDSNASDRALRLAAITEQAIDALGSQEAAELWLSKPAMGLDQRKPIDLLQSSEGAELVKTLLTRMDYGVYA
jgi:putative toxin-antitoxin system antitoxin component (TIGR02293 family)